jgi:protein SCO1/2
MKLLGFVASLLLMTACTDARTRALGELHGVRLAPARAKPDFTLEDTEGRPFAFRAATAGTVTLVYFGYSNCPDVCPTHMSNIASALKKMPAADQARVRVVFVTTDPARDTPEHLRAWLNNFDKRFIGLRGNIQDVNQISSALGLPPSSIEPMPGMTAGPRMPSYGVGHAAQVLAFTPDDSLRVEYPSGFNAADWSNDLPRLLTIRNP